MGFDSGWYTGSVKSGVDSLGEMSADQPTPEQLREFISNELQTADEVVNRRKVGDEFVRVYKEYGYIDNKANAELLKHELQQRGRWNNPTITDFETAFVTLNESGLMQLDAKKLQAEQARLLDARAAEIHAEEFDPASAYLLPLEEVARRAGGHGR
jgi:hypothetical protein